MNYTKISKCRSCGGKLIEIISLGEQTSVGFTDKPEDGVKVPLELVLCEDCHLLQLRHTTDPSLLYNENYGYKSGINELMRSELADIVDSVVVESGDIVVDIGCNDGTLLSNYPRDVIRVGFDPSLGSISNNNLYANCEENLSRGGAERSIFPEFFSAKAFKSVFGKRKARVVTAIAMFYDLNNPNKFLQDCRKILDNDGTLIIQQNYLVGMLKNVAFDNVCHEHLEYFSLTSMEELLNRNGLWVYDVEERDINGGSFRTYIKKMKVPVKIGLQPSTYAVQQMRVKESQLQLTSERPYLTFAKNVEDVANEVSFFVQNAVGNGEKVYVYGASTRGNSLLQVCGLDNKLISGAAERNPTKYGKYTAGTKIKIVSEEEARKKADYFLCLPWFLKESFIEREKEFIKKGGRLIFPLPELQII